MILEGKLSLLVYSDTISSNNPQKRLIDVDENLADSTVDQWETLYIQIADAVADQSIDLNSITGDKFYLKADQTISIKLNGSSDALSGNLFYMQATVSSLSISNSSGSTANITIAVGA
jgi:hypothetical protein